LAFVLKAGLIGGPFIGLGIWIRLVRQKARKNYAGELVLSHDELCMNSIDGQVKWPWTAIRRWDI